MPEERSELEENRLQKLRNIQASGVDAYPPRSHVTHTTRQAITAFEQVEAQADAPQVKVTLAGRIRALRPMGKLCFAHIEDRDGRCQLFFRVDELGEEQMQFLCSELRPGGFHRSQWHHVPHPAW